MIINGDFDEKLVSVEFEFVFFDIVDDKLVGESFESVGEVWFLKGVGNEDLSFVFFVEGLVDIVDSELIDV